jgi:DNA polymerase III subunit delta
MNKKKKYLIKSNNNFLIKKFIKELKLENADYDIHECEDVETFINLLSDHSLFNDSNRIIVLDNLEQESVDAVSAIMNYYSEDVWVLIQKEPLSRNKAYASIKAACNFFEFKNIDESRCAVWVREWLEETKVTFSEDIPSYIVSRVGTDVSKLKNELKKIVLYFDGQSNELLTRRDCDIMFSNNPEAKFFSIVDDFFHKRVEDVFKELKKVDEYSFVKLLHLLIGQAQRLYDIAVYKVNGMSIDDISQLININKYILKTKLFTAISFYNKIKLVQLLDLFNKLDIELRSTKYPKRMVMEYYLIKGMRL